MNDRRVTMRDARAAGICGGTAFREWVQSHGFDFRDVVRNGLTVEQLIATGDPIAKMLVERANVK